MVSFKEQVEDTLNEFIGLAKQYQVKVNNRGLGVDIQLSTDVSNVGLVMDTATSVARRIKSDATKLVEQASEAAKVKPKKISINPNVFLSGSTSKKTNVQFLVFIGVGFKKEKDATSFASFVPKVL